MSMDVAAWMSLRGIMTAQQEKRPLSRVTVRRRGTRLVVAWTRVPEATGYELMTTLSSGEQRIVRVRRPTATVAAVPRSSAGQVRVSAVAPLRAGRPAGARFRATAPRTWKRFGPLPRLR